MAAVNFLLLVIMMSVLRIGEGMESMEMVTNEDIVKFYGDVHFDKVSYEKEKIKGFDNIPIEIFGDNGPVIMSVQQQETGQPANEMKVSDQGIAFSAVDRFDIMDPRSKDNIFSTDYKDFTIPKKVRHLDTKKLRVNRLVSPESSNLTIKSDTYTHLSGSEGIRLRGKEIIFAADGDFYLNSVNGHIHLIADKIQVRKFPVAEPRHHPRPLTQFKLCICMPEGRLFRIPILRNSSIKPYQACSYVDLSLEKSPCTKW